jgi:hypothetical protein
VRKRLKNKAQNYSGGKMPKANVQKSSFKNVVKAILKSIAIMAGIFVAATIIFVICTIERYEHQYMARNWRVFEWFRDQNDSRQNDSDILQETEKGD